MRHLLPSGFSDLAPVSLLDTTKALLVAELAELRRLTPEQEVAAETVWRSASERWPPRRRRRPRGREPLHGRGPSLAAAPSSNSWRTASSSAACGAPPWPREAPRCAGLLPAGRPPRCSSPCSLRRCHAQRAPRPAEPRGTAANTKHACCHPNSADPASVSCSTTVV